MTTREMNPARRMSTRVVLSAVLVSGLALVGDEVGLAKERDEPSSAVVADLKSKIDSLTRRVANLEKEALTVIGDLKSKEYQRVTAPFEVVDKSGNPIFVVADAPHASVARGGRIQIARASNATFSMQVRNGARSVMGIGEIGGGGGMFLADATGASRIIATAETGLELHNKAARGVAHLTVGPTGAGQFWLYDETGKAMVMAGTLPLYGGVGTVQVGPGRKCVPMGTLRVPDCIRGRPEE